MTAQLPTPNLRSLALRASLLVFSIVVLCVVLTPFSVHAAPPRTLQTSPAVIDEKTKQRDIIKQTITLTNTWDRPLKLFPAVEDVNPENGEQGFSYAPDADARSDSLANWIELSRGVIELTAGESKSIPLVIHVNMNAIPGTYHAYITFTDGGTRGESEKKMPDGYVSVNVEVQADIKEDLQLVKFTTDRVAFSGDDMFFNYQIENIGNQELQPAGDIRIYDRKGQEVATIDVNKEGKSVAPEQMAQLASVWSAVNGFGQFKALITVNYGRGQTASVQDTIFFWIVPWKQIFGLLVATLIAMIILALYFHRWFEERHLIKLAGAGLLKMHPTAASAVAHLPTFVTAPPPPRRPPPPPQQVVHQEPKERIIVRVAENVVIAWRLFTTFKRSGRLTPEDIAQKKVFAREVPEPSTPVAEVSHDAPGVSAQWHAWRHEGGHGETVDLKKMRREPKEAIHDGHIVNLKKPL